MNYSSDDNFHKVILENIAKRMRPSCFIELGLGESPSILGVSQFCGFAFGVDVGGARCSMPDNAVIYQMTTDQFFETIAASLPAPELVFIDADHRKEQVLKDLNGIRAIAAENCVVVLHDTFPECEMYTQTGFCADSYRVPESLPCEHVTLPVPPGITICRLNATSLV